jgi:hypothetical protein
MANFPVEGAYNFVTLVESDIRSFVGILPNEDELRGMSSRGASVCSLTPCHPQRSRHQQWDLTYIGDQVGHVQFCTLSQGNGVNRTYLGVYDVKDVRCLSTTILESFLRVYRMHPSSASGSRRSGPLRGLLRASCE